MGGNIALARFGRLRAPSEVMELKWEDIDFDNRRLCIHAPKTAHHRNKGIRYCPIFPELMDEYPIKDVCTWLGNFRQLRVVRGKTLNPHLTKENQG